LTPISLDENAWAGWQLFRPDLKGGFALFFRRPASEQDTITGGLRDLDANATYDVSFAYDYAITEHRRLKGDELARLPLKIASRPGSVLLRFQEVKRASPAHPQTTE